jgi:hypothetical protein
MNTYCSDEELVEALKEFEKNGGEFSNETRRYRSNEMIIQCRNGIRAVSKFIAETRQTCRRNIVIRDGLLIESLKESHFRRETLIIGETIFDCLQWEEALKWTGQVRCIIKKNQLLSDTPITVITKKLMHDYALSGHYYRILAPFGFKHRLTCRYTYSLSDYCCKENQFIFEEPYPIRNITYHETRIHPFRKSSKTDDFFCSICLETYDRMIGLRPCNHTLCSTCYYNATILRCHLCRSTIDSIEHVYDDDTIPPPDTLSMLESLSDVKGLTISSHIMSHTQTFEKAYTKYMKDPNVSQTCHWPKFPIPRIYGDSLKNLIFVIDDYDCFPEKHIIDSLCGVNTDINLHVLYSSENIKQQWENVLSTTG